MPRAEFHRRGADILDHAPHVQPERRIVQHLVHAQDDDRGCIEEAEPPLSPFVSACSVAPLNSHGGKQRLADLAAALPINTIHHDVGNIRRAVLIVERDIILADGLQYVADGDRKLPGLRIDGGYRLSLPASGPLGASPASQAPW